MKRFALISLILASLVLGTGIFLPLNPRLTREVILEVKRGEGTRDIALHLQQEGLISSAPLFRVFVASIGISGNLQAGTYLLAPSLSPFQIAQKLKRGETLKDRVTVIEGRNMRDLGFFFENQGMFQAEELWELAGFPGADYRSASDLPLPMDFSGEYSFLADKPSFVGLEGYLFPDTYHTERGESLKNIVRFVLSNFGEKITPFLSEISAQKRTVFEVITTASLLEKEVRTLEDKKLVAGVLRNRLSLGMALQVDATVAYLTGKKTTQVSKTDTEINSPFNTYKYPGLPLGPIANPGLESIEAALFPTENPYLYYLSTPEGETVFSKTLEEHNAAKALYLR